MIKTYNMRFQKTHPELVIGLMDLINHVYNIIHKQLTVIEVGSYKGESATVMLRTGKVDRIYCIDPWKAYVKKYQFIMNEVENIFDRTFEKDNRVIKHKGTLDTFLQSINKMDIQQTSLVYIDTNLSYGEVKQDIQTSRNIIRPYFVCGHDYNIEKWDDTVVKAVNECFGKPNKIFMDSSWVIKL